MRSTVYHASRHAAVSRSVRHRIVFKRGSVLLRTEQWDKAAAVLGGAVEPGPDRRESHSDLSIALPELPRWEEAAVVVQSARSSCVAILSRQPAFP